MRKCLLNLIFLMGVVLGAQNLAAESISYDSQHKLFLDVLQKHVSNGVVDYKGMSDDRILLDEYLAQLASVTKLTFQSWEEKEQIAFLTNLYNAQTLALILDYYPIKSIRKIGNPLKGPWDQKVVKLWGKVTTLNHVEHKILRKEYNEPRIHFALVCAAKGCPPLRSEPFVADRLNEQLEEQGNIFLSQEDKNRLDVSEGVLYLSPIFKWFKKDFERKADSLTEFVKVYWEKQMEGFSKKWKIKYTHYDWSLNE